MAHTFKAPISVWISQYSHHDADSLQSADNVSDLTLLDPPYDFSNSGYTRVGIGEITITMATKDQIITGKVESLRAELERDRADSQVRQNALIRKIGELEALTYEPSAV